MSDADILMLILGMALVTYLPRAIPVLFVNRLRVSGFANKFLRLIPYTAMSALIFPAVWSVDGEKPVIGLVGGAVAGVLAWLKCPLMVCVLGAILADLLLYTIL